jgi:hypothetical protein
VLVERAHQQVFAEGVEEIDVVPGGRTDRHAQARAHLIDEDLVPQALGLADFVLRARPTHVEASARSIDSDVLRAGWK